MTIPPDNFGGYDPYGSFGSGSFDEPESLPEPKKKRFGRSGKSGKSDAQPAATRRGARSSRKWAIIFGVVAAAIVGIVLLGSSSPVGTYVVRTAVPIAPGGYLTADNLVAVQLPDAAVEEGAITGTDPQSLVTETVDRFDGLVTVVPLPADRQIRPEDLTGALLLGPDVGPDTRALSLKVPYGDAVGGEIRAGDRVDIVGVAEPDGVTGVVAEDVYVAAVTTSEDQLANVASSQTQAENREKLPQDILPTDPLPGIYTVQVPSDKVTSLVALQSNGRLMLVLRGPESADGTSGVIDPLQAVCQSGKSPALHPACSGTPETLVVVSE